MNNNTKVRIRLSKQLFESLSKQIIAEAKKMDMSGGAYTEAVKTPKAKKSPEVSKTDKMKAMEESTEKMKKVEEYNDFDDDDDHMGSDDMFGGAEMGTEEDLKKDLMKAGFSEEDAAKTAAQLVKIGKTKK